MALAVGFSAVSCSDEDDYSPATGKLVQSVVTGSSDVTATSATLNGTVKGLSSQSSSSYAGGFYYGFSEGSLNKTVDASFDGENFSATIDGLTNNTTVYYQAYVTLQKTVTYKGEVKSLVTTDAKVTTGDASNVEIFSASLAGTSTDAPSTATAGFVLAASSDVEAVRAGLRVESEDITSIAASKAGLLPGATYYYAAYLDLGTGIVYGDVKEFETKEYSFEVNDEFVDLGLSTKWAKCNIGASSPEQLGGLFSFGDMTGLNPSTNIEDYAINTDVYKTANDIAYKVYDGKATMPSADEFEELIQSCKAEWTEQNGVAGYTFTGPNGNSIFFPAAGSRTGHAISGEGETGLYLTGSVNPTSSDFAISYEFKSGEKAKTTTPRFQALSVRAVTVAKNVKFDTSLLCKKWHLDIDAEAKSYLWDGPIAYYGTDDSWASVTNNEPTVGGDHWNWSPVYSENSWLGTAADYGYMEFTEDGNVNIHRRVVTTDEEGKSTESYVDETGTYTVDAENKTISLDIDILGFGNFNNVTLDAKTNLKVLSLNENGLQIAILRDPALSGDGACSLAYQYISDELLESNLAINVNVLAVGSDWAGSWGTTLKSYSPSEIEANGTITETVTYEGAMNGAMVFTLDFVRFAKRFPNGAISINSIKADGKEVSFDASKFFYGEIEQNNYRIELFNIWGCGTHKAGNSPFSDNEADLESEPAMSFSESLEITYTIIKDAPAVTDGYMSFPVKLVTINSGWGGSWDWTDGSSLKIGFNAENHAYTFEPQTFKIKFTGVEGVDYSGGSIMTFFQLDGLNRLFPHLHATLDAISIDGTAFSYDPAKVLDTQDSGNYRLELWNCYGSTKSEGCAFGTPNGDVMESLGFKESMELTVTFHSL